MALIVWRYRLDVNCVVWLYAGNSLIERPVTMKNGHL